MKKIILYIAASLDQRIADLDDGLEWLTTFPNLENTDYRYNKLLYSVDTIIMGGRTYREILKMDVTWPYPDQMTYVVTHNKGVETENLRFITDSIIETISAIQNQAGKNIWLVGGGELISMLLAADKIDEMQIIYIPLILGKGISLFPEQAQQSKWRLEKTQSYHSDVFMIEYKRDRVALD